MGGREIGYLFGMYKKLAREHTGVLTGKRPTYGGSLIRPEATGFGAVYFVQHMLHLQNKDIAGKTVAISGFGNVAWGAATKATQLGAKVIAISGPDGAIYDPEGMNDEKIAYMLELRASNNDVVAPFAEKFPSATFCPGKKAMEHQVRHRHALRLPERAYRSRRRGTYQERHMVLRRGFQHGMYP